MFRGVQIVSMDAKGRIAMPSKLRACLPSSCDKAMMCTIDLHSQCLLLYPLDMWAEVERSVQGLPAMKPEVRAMQRLILGYATDLEFDSAGRFLLPQPLRDHACIDKKVALVGLGRKIELWSEELWIGTRDKVLEGFNNGTMTLPDEVLSLVM